MSQKEHLLAGFQSWTPEHLKRIGFYLIDFVANFKLANGCDPKLATIKNYILGIRRGFDSIWGYLLKLLTGDIFVCLRNGLMAVLDNRSRSLQMKGGHTISQILLSKADLQHLFQSASLSKEIAEGFQARLDFSLCILTAILPSALSTLRIKQFEKINVNGQKVWKITSAVGSKYGP